MTGPQTTASAPKTEVQSATNWVGDAWDSLTSNVGEYLMKNRAAQAEAAGNEAQAEQFMALSKMSDMQEHYPNIYEMQQEYPEVFDKIKVQMTGGEDLTHQEMISKIEAGEEIIDVEQVNQIENLIAENPENTRQVMETLQNNPEFMDFALSQSGQGAGNTQMIQSAIENPEMVEQGVKIHQISQGFSDDFKSLFQEHLSGREFSNMDFEGFFEGIMELFQNLIGEGGTLLEGSDNMLANFAEKTLGITGMDQPEDKPEPETQPTPAAQNQAGVNPQDPNAAGPNTPQPGS